MYLLTQNLYKNNDGRGDRGTIGLFHIFTPGPKIVNVDIQTLEAITLDSLSNANPPSKILI